MAVERHTRIDSLAAGWDALADRTRAAPWLRPGWISAWLEAFGGGAELTIFVDRRGSRLTSVLPMLRRRRTLTSPTNWHTPEFGILGEDAEARTALAEALLGDRPRSVTLGWVSPASVEAAHWAAKRAGYRVVERSLMHSPYLPLRADGASSEDSPPRSSTVRRHRRKLERAGELRFEVEVGTEHLLEGLGVEASGWKQKEGSAVVSRPETRRFYQEVARWAAARDALRLCFLRLDERPIAFVLALEDDGRLYYVKGGFDADFRRFGPGVIITHAMIDYARQRGLHSFDFLGGDDPWKLEWTRESRDRRLFQAFAPAVIGWAQWAFYARGRPLAKRLLAGRRSGRPSGTTETGSLH